MDACQGFHMAEKRGADHDEPIYAPCGSLRGALKRNTTAQHEAAAEMIHHGRRGVGHWLLGAFTHWNAEPQVNTGTAACDWGMTLAPSGLVRGPLHTPYERPWDGMESIKFPFVGLVTIPTTYRCFRPAANQQVPAW